MSGGELKFFLIDSRLYYRHPTVTHGYTPCPIIVCANHILFYLQLPWDAQRMGWWATVLQVPIQKLYGS